ncbi:MAG: DUF4395 domain-containing protein [Actinomycetia bacterium]|nr:DUF4395 domain-containing protein [Actinomycetes bacterium]MCH9801386.1 DUF4395 domain-containing protein [Actinomycetes bacterium]
MTDDLSGDVQQEATQAAKSATIDPRGPRFGAGITTLVLAGALLAIPSDDSSSVTLAAVLLGFQALVFGAATFVGMRAQLYGLIYRALVAPRLAPPTEREDPAPPRFAQLVGFIFVVVGLIGLAVGSLGLAQIATGLALAASFLNAVFGFCLGCEIYLLLRRLRGGAAAA